MSVSCVCWLMWVGFLVEALPSESAVDISCLSIMLDLFSFDSFGSSEKFGFRVLMGTLMFCFVCFDFGTENGPVPVQRCVFILIYDFGTDEGSLIRKTYHCNNQD